MRRGTKLCAGSQVALVTMGVYLQHFLHLFHYYSNFRIQYLCPKTGLIKLTVLFSKASSISEAAVFLIWKSIFWEIKFNARVFRIAENDFASKTDSFQQTINNRNERAQEHHEHQLAEILMREQLLLPPAQQGKLEHGQLLQQGKSENKWEQEKSLHALC